MMKQETVFKVLYISILIALILIGKVFFIWSLLLRMIYFVLLGLSIGSGKYKKFIMYITDPYYGINKE